MKTDDLQWLADQAQLPYWEEQGDGVLVANSAATQLLGAMVHRDLLDCLEALLRLPKTQLTKMLQSARDGQRVYGPANASGAWRILLTPISEGRLRCIALPAALTVSAALERRAAAADLVAGVSHEVANALGAVIGWTQLAQMQPELPAVRQALDRIEYSAQAAHSAARLMLSAVRNDSDQSHELLEVSAVMKDVARLLKAEAQIKHVSVHCVVDDPQWIFGSRTQLFTIVWNLAHNAIQAFDAGGTVSLRLEASLEQLRISVEDDGPGIAADQLTRIFEPYFTTKPHGTGLGLALVQRTVDELRGRIEVHSEVGKGTRFVVELPRVQKPRRSNAQRVVRPTPTSSQDARLAPTTTPSSPPRPSRRPGSDSAELSADLTGLRLLIVDDDEGIRDLLVTMLSLYGANVSAAASAGEALGLTDTFDLVCIDLALTDCRGDALLRDLRRRGTVERAILLSGASPPADLETEGRPQHWLRKPFEPQDLIALIVELKAASSS